MTDKAYLHQDRDRLNIARFRKNIAIDETYLHQYHNRLNITGSRKKIAINKIDLEHNKIAIDETHMDSDRQNTIHIWIAIDEKYLEQSRETSKGIKKIHKTGKSKKLNKKLWGKLNKTELKSNILHGSSVCT